MGQPREQQPEPEPKPEQLVKLEARVQQLENQKVLVEVKVEALQGQVPVPNPVQVPKTLHQVAQNEIKRKNPKQNLKRKKLQKQNRHQLKPKQKRLPRNPTIPIRIKIKKTEGVNLYLLNIAQPQSSQQLLQ